MRLLMVVRDQGELHPQVILLAVVLAEMRDHRLQRVAVELAELMERQTRVVEVAVLILQEVEH
jgi:hypothetical protein